MSLICLLTLFCFGIFPPPALSSSLERLILGISRSCLYRLDSVFNPRGRPDGDHVPCTTQQSHPSTLSNTKIFIRTRAQAQRVHLTLLKTQSLIISKQLHLMSTCFILELCPLLSLLQFQQQLFTTESLGVRIQPQHDIEILERILLLREVLGLRPVCECVCVCVCVLHECFCVYTHVCSRVCACGHIKWVKGKDKSDYSEAFQNLPDGTNNLLYLIRIDQPRNVSLDYLWTREAT